MYHKNTIPKGQYGTADKIIEEFEEWKDARHQSIKIMELLELSDLIGAIKGYLESQYPCIGLIDLIKMSNVTQSAFEDGERA